jgi:hypothetical protein
MGVGRRGDEHRAHFPVAERFPLGGDLGAAARGELLRGIGLHVHDIAQPHVLHGGDV